MKRILLAAIVLVQLLSSCNRPSHQLQSGMWRGALVTQSGVEIPFNFEVIDSAGKTYIDIINAENRLRVDEIRQQKDSIFIELPFFEAQLKGEINDGVIDGVYVKRLAEGESYMNFFATAGVNWRIKEKVAETKYSVAGKWETFFIKDNGDTTKAIGNFKQNGNRVTGTFLTRTGDYRFLDGVLDGNNLLLSTFDGGFAMLFTAKVNEDHTLSEGKQYWGFSSVRNFTAIKNENAELEDAYGLTYLKEGYDRIDFSFPDLNKQQVSLSDERFKNKVVVVQILGSWCPNCIDETAFLAQFQEENNFDDVEIVALAYERTTNFDRSKASLERLVKRFNVKYPILITGYTSDKGEPAESLPMLNHVMAFPTTIIIDKAGKVRKIHTGFSGPGSGKYYEDYVKEFTQLIHQLRGEK